MFLLTAGCNGTDAKEDALSLQRIQDSVSEARIDSAYAAIKDRCDTLMVHQVPIMVDSLLKDSSLLNNFFKADSLFKDADEKVEKVIRQLQADCDSSLLKETYRRALLQKRPAPKQHTGRKA